ncbi:cell division protein FtsK, partial [Streptosporangium sp. NPDC048865]
MRIMLTVLNEHADRDVVVEGDETTTVARLAESLAGQGGERPSNVVRLTRSKAPYGLDRDSAGAEPPTLWRDGRPLDPAAPALGLLRDGDLVTLDRSLATATLAEEPGGIVEIRVVGGTAAGSVHRLSLGVHVIGSDPACSVAVADPRLPARAAVVRLTPDAITVEPGEGTAPLLDRAPLEGPLPWPEHALLSCGGTVLTLKAVEPPDAHLDAQPDGGLAYNRPPRFRPPGGARRFEVPAEPRRAETMRLQLLTAFLPAGLGVAMCFALGSWYFLLFAFMTPLIMIGQWWSDRRHGRKQYRQQVKEYRQRLKLFEAAVERARADDETARRAAAPDPAEVLLTVTGPRRRLWERRDHDPDALRLRVGLADLPADLEFAAEPGGEQPLDLLDEAVQHPVVAVAALGRPDGAR